MELERAPDEAEVEETGGDLSADLVAARRRALAVTLDRMKELALRRFTRSEEALEAFFSEAHRQLALAYPVPEDTPGEAEGEAEADEESEDSADSDDETGSELGSDEARTDEAEDPADETDDAETGPDPAAARVELLAHLEQLEELLEALCKM